MKPVIETQRLKLRACTLADVEHIFVLDADPFVRRYVHQPDPPTREQCEEVIARFRTLDAENPSLGFWIAEERVGEGLHFVGWLHLKPPRVGEPQEIGDLELGYRLMRSAWGRGLATEGSHALIDYAFRVLHAPRVTAVALEENIASLRVMEKCGLRRWKAWEYRTRSNELHPVVTYARGVAMP